MVAATTRIICAAAVTACSGPPAGAGASADAGSPGADAFGDGASEIAVDPTTPEGFCAAVLGIQADALVRCNGASPASVQALEAQSVPCQRFSSSIAAGRTGFDPTQASACLAALRGTTGCDGMSMPSPACSAVISPLVPRGGSCASFYIINFSGECMGDDYCSALAGACSGVCAARMAVGSSCDPFSNTSRCASGAECDLVAHVCVAIPPAVAAGAPCEAQGQGSCQAGLYCDRSGADAGGSGACRAKQTSGPCATSDACASPAHCAGPTGAKSCAPIKHVGDPCTAGWGECGLESYCGVDGHCTDLGAPTGQPCGAAAGELVVCAPGNYCSGSSVTSGICTAQSQPGGACTGASPTECAGNARHCDSTTKRCATCPI